MFEKIRIIPVLIIAASLLFGLKVDDVWNNAGRIGFTSAHAKQEDKPQSTRGQAKQDNITQIPKTDPANEASAKGTDKAVQTASLEQTTPARPINVNNLSPAEIELLQNLAKRRDKIDARSRELQMREAILSATEKRIDGKIKKLKDLETRVQGMIDQHDEEAESRIKSLVKVYESMKPKAAARIFENLEMSVLIDVAQRMKEKKMAAVLASMDSKRAREVTVRLAKQKELPKTGG